MEQTNTSGKGVCILILVLFVLSIVTSVVMKYVRKDESNAVQASDKTDYVSDVADYLWDNFEFESKSGVNGSARILCDVGCKAIKESTLNKDTGEVYVIEFIDIDDNVFVFNIGHDGYIGPVRGEDGEYLYAPVD